MYDYKNNTSSELNLKKVGGKNIEKYAEDLVKMFRYLLLDFLIFVQKDKRKKYFSIIKKCIQYVELIVVIEVQLSLQEIQPKRRDLSDAKISRDLFFNELENAILCYNPSIHLYALDFVNYCALKINDHVDNIRKFVSLI